jgi:hypothetical protein
MAGVPLEETRRAEDAVAFFERQAEVDKKVSAVMQEIHDKTMQQLNRRRRELPPIPVGSKVWYLRPRGRTGEKLETYWIGPARVVERRGEHSYVVELEPGRMQEAHRSQLKEHVEDVFSDKPLRLFHFRQAIQDSVMAANEWEVEGIEGHRQGEDGFPEFCVKWAGYEERTWEPLKNFFHRFNRLVLAYCDKKKVKVPDVLGYLYHHQPGMDVNNIMREAAPQDWLWPGQDTIISNDDGKLTGSDHDQGANDGGQDRPAANAMGFHGVLRAAWSERQPRTVTTSERQGDSNRAQPKIGRPRGASC